MRNRRDYGEGRENSASLYGRRLGCGVTVRVARGSGVPLGVVTGAAVADLGVGLGAGSDGATAVVVPAGAAKGPVLAGACVCKAAAVSVSISFSWAGPGTVTTTTTRRATSPMSSTSERPTVNDRLMNWIPLKSAITPAANNLVP